MTDQRVHQAALPGVDLSGEHDPPGARQPEPHACGRTQTVGCPRAGIRVAAGHHPGDTTDFQIEGPGRLPGKDSRCFGPPSLRQVLQGQDGAGVAPLVSEPFLPRHDLHARRLQRREHGRGSRDAAVTLDLQPLAGMANDDHLLARGPPGSEGERPVWSGRDHDPTTGGEQAVDDRIGLAAGQRYDGQCPAAGRGEQCRPHALASHG